MSLDVFQQVFSLSLASNMVNEAFKGTQASLRAALQLGLTVYLPKIDKDWKVVWGPVVWKHEPENAETGPDNSWYIAFHPRLQFEDGSVHPTYVIAIAGTPSESKYAWVEENFAINSVADFKVWVAGGIENPPAIVPFKDIVAGNAYIAKGIVKTVHLLLTTPAPEGAVSAGTTLFDFITNVDNSASPRFITTGHSLGGSLSPPLALALHPDVPFRGAQSRKLRLTALFVNTFPARKSSEVAYKGWNLNLVNTLDIAPHAWAVFPSISEEQNLGNIPPIYGKPVIRFVSGATLVFALRSLSSGVRYKPIPSQYFTGTTPPTPPTTLPEFIKILLPEHIGAYLKEVGVPKPTLDWSTIPDCGLREKTEAEKLYSYPVICDFEWGLEHPKEAQHDIDEAEGNPEGQAFLSGTE